MLFKARSYQFDLSRKVLIMGVINITPDSFSDGGKFFTPEKAAERALELVGEGADILDFGAVSTRPGALLVSEEEEQNRLIPVLKRICGKISVPISVDTTSSEVAREALDLGASIINDVSGLEDDPKMAGLIASYKAAAVLMHRRGNSQTMQKFVEYRDVISEVKAELEESIQIAQLHGIPDESIVIDPGIGFSKTAAQNLEILKHLREFEALGFPVMIGTSRKSFIGQVLNREIPERKTGTIASCVLAVREGAKILRVHDVTEVRDAVRMTLAIIGA